MKRPKYQTYIVTRGRSSYEQRAESREDLGRKLAKHAEEFPNSRPVTAIREGSLQAEWMGEEKKFWQS
jgi:hypothetical protein